MTGRGSSPFRWALPALAAVLVMSTACSAAGSQFAAAAGPWAGWATRGDRADDGALHTDLLAAPGVRAVATAGAVHLLWLGAIPPGGESTELAVLAVERTAPGRGPRPDAAADVVITRRGGPSGAAPSWGPLQPLGALDPADPGIDVAALQDLNAAASDAFLLRSDIRRATIARAAGSRVAATVRPDGVVLVPGGGGGASCDPPVVIVAGNVLVPGVGAPLPIERDGDEVGLVSVVAGLTCGPTVGGTAPVDILTSSIRVTRRVGALDGTLGGEVAHLRIEDRAGVHATLAIVPSAGVATIGLPRDGGSDAYAPFAVRIAVPAGAVSLLAVGSRAGPVTVPALPVTAGASDTWLLGPVAGPVAVVSRDPQDAPIAVDLVR